MRRPSAEQNGPADPSLDTLAKNLSDFARLPAQRDAAWSTLPCDDSPIVVGIAGGTGSGKTTVAAAIASRLGEDNLIHLQHDSYYRPLPQTMSIDERAKTNFDHPDALETSLLCEHLRSLKSGQAVRVPSYDFATHQRCEGDELKEPARIILVEGILIYAHQPLREMLDIKIFVDTESDVRFIRRLRRDVSERGRDVDSVISQYLETVRPMHNQFVEPSKVHADIVIPTGFNTVALEMVIARLEQLLEWGNTVPTLEKRQSTPRMPMRRMPRCGTDARPTAPASGASEAGTEVDTSLQSAVDAGGPPLPKHSLAEKNGQTVPDISETSTVSRTRASE